MATITLNTVYQTVVQNKNETAAALSSMADLINNNYYTKNQSLNVINAYINKWLYTKSQMTTILQSYISYYEGDNRYITFESIGAKTPAEIASVKTSLNSLISNVAAHNTYFSAFDATYLVPFGATASLATILGKPTGGIGGIGTNGVHSVYGILNAHSATISTISSAAAEIGAHGDAAGTPIAGVTPARPTVYAKIAKNSNDITSINTSLLKFFNDTTGAAIATNLDDIYAQIAIPGGNTTFTSDIVREALLKVALMNHDLYAPATGVMTVLSSGFDSAVLAALKSTTIDIMDASNHLKVPSLTTALSDQMLIAGKPDSTGTVVTVDGALHTKVNNLINDAFLEQDSINSVFDSHGIPVVTKPASVLIKNIITDWVKVAGEGTNRLGQAITVDGVIAAKIRNLISDATLDVNDPDHRGNLLAVDGIITKKISDLLDLRVEDHVLGTTGDGMTDGLVFDMYNSTTPIIGTNSLVELVMTKPTGISSLAGLKGWALNPTSGIDYLVNDPVDGLVALFKKSKNATGLGATSREATTSTTAINIDFDNHGECAVALTGNAPGDEVHAMNLDLSINNADNIEAFETGAKASVKKTIVLKSTGLVINTVEIDLGVAVAPAGYLISERSKAEGIAGAYMTASATDLKLSFNTNDIIVLEVTVPYEESAGVIMVSTTSPVMVSFEKFVSPV